MTFILRLKLAMQTQRRRSLHIGKTHDQYRILRHIAEAFSPARQGTILNSHQVIGIATNNTSMVLNCALVTYILMTADVGLPDAVYCHTQDENIPK